MAIMENLRISRRLALGFGITIAGLLLLLTMALWSIQRIDRTFDEALQNSDQNLQARELRAEVDAVLLNVSQLLLHSAETNAKREEIQEHRTAADQARARLEKLSEKLVEAKNDEAKDDGLAARLSELEEQSRESNRINNKVMELAMMGKVAEGTSLYLREAVIKNDKLASSVSALLELTERRKQDLLAEAQSLRSNVTIALLVGGILIALLGTFFSILFTRSITEPMKRISSHLKEMAQGNFSIAVKSGAKERKDEMGDVARALDLVNETICKVMSEITNSVQTLSAAASELSTISSQADQGSQATSEQANSVAVASEQMSSNLNSVSSGMEQMSSGVNTIVTSVEEMTATIADIANNSEKARNMTSGAVAQAVRISELMRELGNAAKDIGKVTETITAISSQTNLLALNATIEAARAGSAGKGFAVVANEIKELAQQTAAATEDIKAKIHGIQSSTASTVADIQKISQAVQDVNDIVGTIASSIEEQSAVTRDIAGNITQTSQTIHTTTNQLNASTGVAQEITRAISSVHSSAREIHQGSAQIRDSAAELSSLSEQLKCIVSLFKVN